MRLDVQAFILEEEEQKIRFAFEELNEQQALIITRANAKDPKGSKSAQSDSLASETVAVERPILAKELSQKRYMIQ